MKNILICVDSVFQFIIASNLRTTVYKDDCVDLAIYNSYTSAKQLYENIKDDGYFNKVYFANSPLTYCGKNYTFKEKLPKYFVYLESLVAPRKVLKNILKFDLKTRYDHFIFNGDGALPECIFNVCLKNNKDLECYRIEDGYASYMNEFGKTKGNFRLRFEKLMHSIFKTKNIRNYIRGYFMSDPRLACCDFPYPLLNLPKFSRSNKELVSFLNKALNYNISDNEQFKDKIIFFEDGSSFFDGKEEDLEIMEQITQTVSKEKILVKRHPRRKEDRFAPMGIKCCTVDGVPWEVIAMNCEFKNQVLLTSCSGTVLNTKMYFDDECKKIYYYKLLKNPPFIVKDKNFIKFMNRFIEVYGDGCLLMPNSMNELIEMLRDAIY